MTRLKETDRILILTVFSMLIIGIMMIYSSSYIMAMKRFGDEYLFVRKQIMFMVIAFISFVAAINIPYRIYRILTYPFLIISTVLLLLVFFDSIGFQVGGARRWLTFGPIRFQPSELAKLAVIIFLAYSLEAKGEKIKTFFPGLLPHIIIPAVPILLIFFEPDFGTAVVLTTVTMIMMYIAGVRFSYLISIIIMAIPSAYLTIMNAGYRLKRILVFFDPWKDPGGAGFQMVQSYLALGSGGLYGVGLGEGRQKLFFLPEAHTDFILSILGEEMGFIGLGVVVLLFVLFLVCGIRAALKAPDMFGTYLAVGLTIIVVLQAVMNMGVVTGLLPPKGLPLPFISYGGTSLVINMTMAGIILNIYRSGLKI